MEENLIKMLKDGDKSAFEPLVDMYKRKLYTIAKSRLNETEDVKDAIQETLLKTYKNIYNIDETCFNGWITKVLINNCNDILRSKGNDLYYDYVENIEYEHCLNQAYEENSNTDFFSIIDFLNAEDKTLVTMYYSHGYTTDEISKILNMNESTVRTKMMRIRNKIKDKYE